MAITKLSRDYAAGEVSITGNEVTASDPWILRVSTKSSAISAYSQILAGGAGFGFPAIGASHPQLSSLKFVDFTVVHDNAQRTQFRVSGNYSNISAAIDVSSVNPLNAQPIYEYTQVDYEFPVINDLETGTQILNYAGKPFSTPIIETASLTRINVTRNERSYNNSRAERFRNSVCETSVRINRVTYDKLTARLDKFTGSKQFDQDGRAYYVVNYQVTIKEDGWQRELLELGTRNGDGRTPPDSTEVNGAAALDEDGSWRDSNTEDPPFLSRKWNTAKTAQWRGLRL